jgi:biopolymer transport protein ExbD
MIDVIFAILTFFIMSTLFLTRSAGLPVNLPGAATAEQQAQTQLVVTIRQDGSLALDRQPIQLEELETALRRQVRPGSLPLVVINADMNVSHGRVVAVMDQVRRIQGIRMAIATQRP